MEYIDTELGQSNYHVNENNNVIIYLFLYYLPLILEWKFYMILLKSCVHHRHPPM